MWFAEESLHNRNGLEVDLPCSLKIAVPYRLTHLFHFLAHHMSHRGDCPGSAQAEEIESHDIFARVDCEGATVRIPQNFHGLRLVSRGLLQTNDLRHFLPQSDCGLRFNIPGRPTGNVVENNGQVCLFRHGLEVAKNTFLRRLVVVGHTCRLASAPTSLAAFVSVMASEVELEPVPAITGIRPAVLSTTNLTTSVCSSWDRVGDSPVVPQGRIAAQPISWIVYSTSLSRPSQSIPRSSLKGVITGITTPRTPHSDFRTTSPPLVFHTVRFLLEDCLEAAVTLFVYSIGKDLQEQDTGVNNPLHPESMPAVAVRMCR